MTQKQEKASIWWRILLAGGTLISMAGAYGLIFFIGIAFGAAGLEACSPEGREAYSLLLGIIWPVITLTATILPALFVLIDRPLKWTIFAAVIGMGAIVGWFMLGISIVGQMC